MNANAWCRCFMQIAVVKLMWLFFFVGCWLSHARNSSNNEFVNFIVFLNHNNIERGQSHCDCIQISIAIRTKCSESKITELIKIGVTQCSIKKTYFDFKRYFLWVISPYKCDALTNTWAFWQLHPIYHFLNDAIVGLSFVFVYLPFKMPPSRKNATRLIQQLNVPRRLAE